MTDSNSPMQVRAGSEAMRSKGSKGKTSVKIKKDETSSRKQIEQLEARRGVDRQPDHGVSPATPSRDPHLIARIQQRAYVLFKACGCEHGHDLEHWLEAERQITGSPEHSDR